MNTSFRPLGTAEVGYGPDGSLVVRKSTLRPSHQAALSGFGSDYGADDDFGADDFAADLSPAEAAYFGALSRDEKRAFRARRRAMRQGNRAERRDFREDRRDARLDRDAPAVSARRGPPALEDGVPYFFSGQFTITAAGAWSITILPQTGAILKDMVLTGPAGTLVSSVTIGILPVLTAGATAIEVFQGNSFVRELVLGREVSPSLPVVIAGTTTATSGIITASIIGRGGEPR